MVNRALTGTRVLEVGGDETAYAGKLLADLGADVLKIEPPGGSRERLTPPFTADGSGGQISLRFSYLNTNKRSRCVDETLEEGMQELQSLLSEADVLLTGLRPQDLERAALSPALLEMRFPRLVMVAITGFGLSGPRQNWKSTDLVAQAMSRIMYTTGTSDRGPVAHPEQMGHPIAGIYGAAAALMLLYERRSSGRGQTADVSIQEAVAAYGHYLGASKYQEDGLITRRSERVGFNEGPSFVYPCADGVTTLQFNRPAHWDILSRWIFEVTGDDLALSPLFQGSYLNRLRYPEAIDALVSDFTRRFSREELFREGQRRRLAVAPVQDPSDVARDRQLNARNFFRPVKQGERNIRYPGPPYRLSHTPAGVSEPAPALDDAGDAGWRTTGAQDPPPARTHSTGPLAGLRVLELTVAGAAPWAGRHLAYAGAEVIRVESRRYPDFLRLYIPPSDPEARVDEQCSPSMVDWQGGKLSVGIEYSEAEGQALLLRLVSLADVVIENNGAGTLRKLGLTYETFQAARPDLIFLSMPGYGLDGPQSNYLSFGLNLEAVTGAMYLTGYPDGPAICTSENISDWTAGGHATVAILAALEYRARTGEGQRIEVAQIESMAAMIGPAVLDYTANKHIAARLGNRVPHLAPYNAYPCRGDDRWCAITVRNEEEWEALCHASGHPEWLHDPRFNTLFDRLANVEALDDAIAAWTGDQEAQALASRLQAAGVPAGPVQDLRDLFSDPHLAARGYFERVPHVVRGEVQANGLALRFSRTPGATGLSGTALGGDNPFVLMALLGLSESSIARLHEGGIVVDPAARADGKPTGVTDKRPFHLSR